MTWRSITKEEAEFTNMIVKWIETVREAYNDPTWLPADPDCTKSALFERIRNGLEPLKFPPPRGYSCPWYAVVEDPGPHWIEFRENELYFLKDVENVHFRIPCNWKEATHISILQSNYMITHSKSSKDFYVRDDDHTIKRMKSPYEFHVWWDPEYRYTSIAKDPPKGAWLMRNVEFEK